VTSTNFGKIIPNQDNIELTGLPYTLLMNGQINSAVKSMIIGTTSNEGSAFISPTLSATQNLCNANYPFCQWGYPCSSYNSICYNAMVDCYTDLYVCSTDGIIKSTALTSKVNVYVYQFTSTPSFYKAILGPTHTSEISFVWRYPYYTSAASFTSAETSLSNDMNNYWISLATTGNPNSNYVSSTWNNVSGTTLNIIQFQSNGVTPYTTLTDFISYINPGASKTQQCQLWNAQALTNANYAPLTTPISSSTLSISFILLFILVGLLNF